MRAIYTNSSGSPEYLILAVVIKSHIKTGRIFPAADKAHI